MSFFTFSLSPPFLIDGTKESSGIFSILPGNLLSESTSRSVFVYACMDVCIYLYICLWNVLLQYRKVYLFTDSSDNFALCILHISKPHTESTVPALALLTCCLDFKRVLEVYVIITIVLLFGNKFCFSNLLHSMYYSKCICSKRKSVVFIIWIYLMNHLEQQGIPGGSLMCFWWLRWAGRPWRISHIDKD